jgi:hypothetical protein
MGGDAEAIRAVVLRIDQCAERGARVEDLERVLRKLEKIRHDRKGERDRAGDAA